MTVRSHDLPNEKAPGGIATAAPSPHIGYELGLRLSFTPDWADSPSSRKQEHRTGSTGKERDTGQDAGFPAAAQHDYETRT